MELYKLSPLAAKERLVEFTASNAVTLGCGNCEEQAMLAFIYLRDKGIYPLDILHKPNFLLKFGGHAFVVIGRNEDSSSNTATWGESAVVVDPHGEEKAFPASQIGQYSSLRDVKFELVFRQNSKSDTAIRQVDVVQ